MFKMRRKKGGEKEGKKEKKKKLFCANNLSKAISLSVKK